MKRAPFLNRNMIDFNKKISNSNKFRGPAL
nr:MAG TPA: hypothetical protein [Caudoviricetes sp.]